MAFKAIITYADMRQEEVTVDVVGPVGYAQFVEDRIHIPKTYTDYVDKGLTMAGLPPLGAKRLPQVGEVWSTPSGSLAAVVSQATILDGGYNVVVLTKGSTTAMPGRTYVVDLDGNWLGSKEPVGDRHPLALARFVRRFDLDAADAQG